MSRQRWLPAQVAVVVRNQGTEGFRFVLRQPNCSSLPSIHGILTRNPMRRGTDKYQICVGGDYASTMWSLTPLRFCCRFVHLSAVAGNDVKRYKTSPLSFIASETLVAHFSLHVDPLQSSALQFTSCTSVFSLLSADRP